LGTQEVRGGAVEDEGGGGVEGVWGGRSEGVREEGEQTGWQEHYS